jgi:threonine dehydrogenase-like Zn-dependent dehydrogenase
VPTDRELWFLGPGQVELRPATPPPALQPGEVRARALCSGISQGTELLLYRGEGPARFDPSLDGPGTTTYPRRYGYSWVGEVVESRADGLAGGRRIFALRPHGDCHVLRRGEVRLLPDDLPPARATLAANLETALNVAWDAGLALGDRLVVLGGGVVGLSCAIFGRLAGAESVHVVDPSPRRRQAALALGATTAVAPESDAPAADADVVIEATGDPACLDRAIAHAGIEAAVVVASFYGARTSPIALGTDFHRRRLRLVSSQVSQLPPHKLARWDRDRRFATVLHHLRDALWDGLLDAPVPFAEAPGLYARLAADPGAGLHSVFDYR